MRFAGPDLMVSKFQTEVIIASTKGYTVVDLECAATRLLSAWPTLSFRTNLTRSRATEKEASTIADGFFAAHELNRNIRADLIGHASSHGATVYDSSVLGNLFKVKSMPLVDLLRPRIFTIHAIIFRDATLFKFTIQHAAGDATSLYMAAEAFFQCLHGAIPAPESEKESRYTVPCDESVKPRKQSQRQIRLSLRTEQARRWWDICTGNKMFPIVTLARKWQDFIRVRTIWQTMHLPEHILQHWRAIAQSKGFKASNFDLFAAWIHLNLADFAHDLRSNIPETLAFTINVNKSLDRSRGSKAALSNPFSIAIVSPLSQSAACKQDRLLQGAISIRNHINEVRNPAYISDYNSLMAGVPHRQSQIRGMGKRVPASLLLTSWSNVPFADLDPWHKAEDERRPAIIQPIIGCIPSIPLPERYALDRQIGIIWEGKKNDGCWFTANLEHDLWSKLLDISL